jgi:hypothetical protein
MIFHARTLISQSDQELFERVKTSILGLPDQMHDSKHGPVEPNCHILARAVAQVFRLRYVDGYYALPSHPHSWVMAPGKSIMDVYPVGLASGPVLFDDENCWIGNVLYLKFPLQAQYRKNLYTPKFRRHVAVVARHLGKQARLPFLEGASTD